MHYAWPITVTAGTAEDTPKTEILKLSKGVITRADVKFPAGCHGLVKVRLYRNEFQLIPLSGNQWITGDDETVPTEEYYELLEDPAQLKFVGCSPGTSYDHEVTVRVTVLPKEVATFMPLIQLLTAFLKRIGVIPS